MNKKEFLTALEQELKKKKHKNINDVLEYYDELIEDKKETGKKEKLIIEELGNIKKIVGTVKMEKQLEITEEKPTISNGIKTLVAILGILSIPMLIPIGAVIFAFLVTIIAILFSIIAVIFAIIFASVVTTVALFTGLLLGKIPFLSFLFVLGLLLLILGLAMILTKWMLEKAKQFTSWMVNYIKRKINKKKEVNE